jgi:hypothetical protein
MVPPLDKPLNTFELHLRSDMLVMSEAGYAFSAITDLSHGDMQLTGSDLPSATGAAEAGKRNVHGVQLRPQLEGSG